MAKENSINIGKFIKNERGFVGIVIILCLIFITILVLHGKNNLLLLQGTGKQAEANSIPEVVLKGDAVKVKFVGQLPNGAKPISIWGYFYNGGWHIAVGDDKSNIWALEWESPKK